METMIPTSDSPEDLQKLPLPGDFMDPGVRPDMIEKPESLRVIKPGLALGLVCGRLGFAIGMLSRCHDAILQALDSLLCRQTLQVT